MYRVELDLQSAPPMQKDQRDFTVSLIIPTFNEAENLPLVFSYIPFEWVDEVILVDGRSTDRTVEVAKTLLPEIKVVLEKEPGKGIALQAGYQAATGDILIVMDADGSNDPREIPRFVRALAQGADFVKGSRFAPQGGTTDMGRLRMYGNWAFVKLSNLLFATQFSDLLYGYHAFWRYCLDLFDLSGINGFEIDAYLYLQAVRARLRIVDVPSFEGYRFNGSSNLKTFPDGWRVLKTILKEWISFIRSDKTEPYKGFRTIDCDDEKQELARQKLRRLRIAQQARMTANSNGQILPNSLQLLQNSIQQLPKDDTFQKILPDLLALAMKEIKASSGSVMLLDDDGKMEQGYSFQDGRIRSMNRRQSERALNHGLASWVLLSQRPTIVDNTLEDPRWLSSDWEVKKGISRSAVGLPVVDQDNIRAVITLEREDGPFSDIDLEITE